MRILVTGGAGFVGSRVVDRLVSDGHDVVVLDRRVPSLPGEAVDYRCADVRDPEAWLACLRGVDAVSHQAAVVGGGGTDVRDYVACNDAGTAAGLWALDRIGFSGRLVVASTTAVYGDLRGEPLSEQSPVDPQTVYAATKLHQEHLCLAFGREHGLSVIVLRYAAVHGPGMSVDSPDATAPGGPVAVEDVATANALALSAPPHVSGVLNVVAAEGRLGDAGYAAWELAQR